MMHESAHVSTSIHRSADDVYAFVTDPENLPTWAAGLADSPLRNVDGRWVADSPLGRVTVEFVGQNDLGVADHEVTLPSGEKVMNPMRIIPNGDGCDVVFSVRRLATMSEADMASDLEAVALDLASLRSLMEP